MRNGAEHDPVLGAGPLLAVDILPSFVAAWTAFDIGVGTCFGLLAIPIAAQRLAAISPVWDGNEGDLA